MTKPKSKSKSKPASSSATADATQMAAETPEIRYKAPHNYVGILIKPTDNHTFDSILDILSASKYKTLITADAPIYLDTQREFWKNATLEKQGDIIAAINSSIQGKKVQISPKSIFETFKLDDLNGKTSFTKDELVRTGAMQNNQIGIPYKRVTSLLHPDFYSTHCSCVFLIKQRLLMRYQRKSNAWGMQF